jgi:hypothetical protein
LDPELPGGVGENLGLVASGSGDQEEFLSVHQVKIKPYCPTRVMIALGQSLEV